MGGLSSCTRAVDLLGPQDLFFNACAWTRSSIVEGMTILTLRNSRVRGGSDCSALTTCGRSDRKGAHDSRNAWAIFLAASSLLDVVGIQKRRVGVGEYSVVLRCVGADECSSRLRSDGPASSHAAPPVDRSVAALGVSGKEEILSASPRLFALCGTACELRVDGGLRDLELRDWALGDGDRVEDMGPYTDRSNPAWAYTNCGVVGAAPGCPILSLPPLARGSAWCWARVASPDSRTLSQTWRGGLGER